MKRLERNANSVALATVTLESLNESGISLATKKVHEIQGGTTELARTYVEDICERVEWRRGEDLDVEYCLESVLFESENEKDERENHEKQFHLLVNDDLARREIQDGKEELLRDIEYAIHDLERAKQEIERGLWDPDSRDIPRFSTLLSRVTEMARTGTKLYHLRDMYSMMRSQIKLALQITIPEDAESTCEYCRLPLDEDLHKLCVKTWKQGDESETEEDEKLVDELPPENEPEYDLPSSELQK